MSIEYQEKVCCPGCHHEQAVTIWESINVNLDPYARQDLLNCKINSFVCESCGDRIVIPAVLMYHDMTRQFLVQYFPFGEILEDDFFSKIL